MSTTLFVILFSYAHDHHRPPPVSADEWLEANTADTDTFISSSSSSFLPCSYENEKDHVVSAMKQLLAAKAAMYEGSEKEGDCSICLGELGHGSGSGSSVQMLCRLSRCKHVFHLDCIEKWVERDHYTCPLCRNFIFLP
ncbi:RING-H2 finger protein ATL18 [Linum perenne]